MTKRKLNLDPALYNVNLPMPKWPRWDEPEKWTQDDIDSAFRGNGLNIDEPKGYMRVICKDERASLFLQAVDLAYFDDYYVYMDQDLEDVMDRQKFLCHAAVECSVQ